MSKPRRIATAAEIEATQREVRRILDVIGYRVPPRVVLLTRLDSVVLNPIAGPILLAVVLFLMFQAVFSWARAPMDFIAAEVGALGNAIGSVMPAGPLRGLLVDGIIAGTGSVLVFLPQILILFFFILALEDRATCRAPPSCSTGSWAASACRAVPLFRCCRASRARSPASWPPAPFHRMRDRLATIMIAPLMTCSARLPVYALLIGAFIPAAKRDRRPSTCRASCCSRLYAAGVVERDGRGVRVEADHDARRGTSR